MELLPARPKTLKKGTIAGLLGKGQFTINALTWDTDAHKVRVTLTSGIDQNLTLIERAGITAITADGATVQSSPLGGIARVLVLPKGRTVTVELTVGA